MPFKIPDDKRIKAANLDAFFSQYSDNMGPLESALGGAIMRDKNARLPSPAAPTDPNIPATEIPKSIYNSGFGLIPKPVGGGSWFNLSKENRDSQNAMQEAQMRELINKDEQAKVIKLILSNPELAGQDPSAWDLRGIQAYLRQIKAAKPENPLKTQKDKLAIEKARLLNDKLKAEADKRDIFAPPAVPGAAAPGGEVKTVAGKKFKKVNGAWVQI